MNLTKDIELRIEKFVAELNGLVRKQALDAVTAALGGAAQREAPRQVTNGASKPAAKAPRVRARQKGQKRTQEELAQLESALEAHVRSNPGQRVEEIGKALGAPTSELARPMKKLIANGAVRTEGQRRATKYFPAGTAPRAAAVASGDEGRSTDEGASKEARSARAKKGGKKSAKKKR